MLHSVLLHLTEVKPHFRRVWHDAMSLIFTLTINKRLQRLQVVHASVMSKPIINFRRRVGQTTAGSQMLRFTFSGDGIWHRKLDWLILHFGQCKYKCYPDTQPWRAVLCCLRWNYNWTPKCKTQNFNFCRVNFYRCMSQTRFVGHYHRGNDLKRFDWVEPLFEVTLTNVHAIAWP